MRLLAISGSLRAAANSRKVLEAAIEAVPEPVEVDRFEGLAELPIFSEEIERPAPAAVAGLRERLEAADGLLVVTPEYNASIPGGLKNAVDWASRPAGESSLADKPAAVIANSGSPFGGTWAGEQLRRALTFAGADVTDSELAIGQVTEKLEHGRVGDPETVEQIAGIAEELLSAAGARLGSDDRDLARAATQ